MQWSILWKGRQYDSREHCLIKTSEAGTNVDSVIVGQTNNIIYRVEYNIQLDHDWQVLAFKISSIHNSTIQRLDYTSDGKGNWMDQGKEVPQLQGCIDIDLPLTPFTNTIPIKRLGMKTKQEQQVSVVYIDLLNQLVSPVHQKYTCLTPNQYHYQNVPNDFEATITVDDFGLVTEYPLLFEQEGIIAL